MSAEPGSASVDESVQGLAEFLDSNTPVRYLMRDDVAMADRAAALIESDRRLRLSVLTLAEICFVLIRVYGLSRERVVDALIAFLNRQNIEMHEISTDLAIEALRLCRPSGRVNFADALLWAVARTATPARVWSFDARFPADDIELQRP